MEILRGAPAGDHVSGVRTWLRERRGTGRARRGAAIMVRRVVHWLRTAWQVMPWRPRTPGGVGAKRCLVVDDSAANLLLMRVLLTHAGHEAVAVSDGRAALEAVSRETFDVVFLDLQMPGISGFEVLAELRSRAVLPPVVVVSSIADQAVVTDVLKAGAAAYVQKPISRERVLSALADAVSIRVEVPVQEARQAAFGEPCTLDEMREWDDVASIRKFLGFVLAGLIDGVRDVDRAIDAGRFEDAADRVHAMKNDVASVGDEVAVRRCKALEIMLRRGARPDAAEKLAFRTAIDAAIDRVRKQPELQNAA